MDYEVIISEKAESQLDRFIYHVLVVLGDEQAAASVLDDAEKTKERLSHVAGSLKISASSERLKRRHGGLRC